MDTSKYFSKLKPKISTELLNELRNFANEAEKKGEYFNPVALTDTSNPVNSNDNIRGQFTVVPVPTYLSDKLFIKDLKKISKINTIILRIPPQYYVNWHKDLSRKAGINIPLYEYDSYTCWSPDVNTENDVNKSVKLVRLNYELGSAYLINTDQYHCVSNFSTEYRHIVVIFLYDESYEYFRTELSKLNLI
jgi:hypothetical protein